MSRVKHSKVVAALPSVLDADTIYYVRTGAGFDIFVTNGIGLISQYQLNADKAIKDHVGSGGESHSIVTSQKSGFMSPEQLLASQNGPVQYFNAAGKINAPSIKVFMGTATTDVDGEFVINWSKAGFSAKPFFVSCTAFSSNEVVAERVVCSMHADAAQTTTTGYGYALKGAKVSIDAIGIGPSIRVAPNQTVKVMAWGM